jgi:ectoine hydroxylase-related dioxygenase (phytanoyl-CoA dioxygenase family)
MGTIAVLEGSHRLESFDQFRRTYGQLDTEAAKLDGTGWFCTDPREVERFGGTWVTSDFQAGDIVLFTMQTVHMSTKNITERVRISCDIRWQPADEEADSRYVGEFNVDDRVKAGAHADDTVATKSKDTVTMDALKREWRLATPAA